MAVFPVFLNLEHRCVLLVGDGTVAASKLGPLLEPIPGTSDTFVGIARRLRRQHRLSGWFRCSPTTPSTLLKG